MFDPWSTNPLTDGLTALGTALDGLIAADLTGLSADELLEGLRGFEGFRRGPTSTDNCALLCGHHHRNFNQHGWTGQLTNDTVTWTPPPWIDPTQTPRHNTTHDPPPRM